FVDLTVAVRVKEPVEGTLALEVVRVMEVATGAPAPTPVAIEPPPPPQPSTLSRRTAAAKIAAVYRALDLAQRNKHIAKALAKLIVHQVGLPSQRAEFRSWDKDAVVTTPPLGAGVVKMRSTGTGLPFKF